MSETDDLREAEDGTGTSQQPQVELRPALEAILMIADEPLEHLVLAQAVGHPPTDVERTLRELADEYTEQGRGFELREVAGGWRFYSRESFADVVAAFVLEGQQAKLSQAALETLAVVAYRQPVSRSRISAIRGVNVDGVVRTLVTRGLIVELGNDAETGAVLYGTTSYFLERMGLSGLDELPELAPMLPDLEDLDSELERVAQQTAEKEAVPTEAPVTEDVDVPSDDARE
ncbi:SMC-Scp complex subunit ScpB [Aeromicrobium sp.]|uniref:SMC-Scp complex subunit ScpB n=1 Tax=Aeromicrobium sp. TaxID=1871063 RepID=UPI0028A9CF7A|nr:SMC-Scp complex subunit ScpB [Aeromicrobium sp.]